MTHSTKYQVCSKCGAHYPPEREHNAFVCERMARRRPISIRETYRDTLRRFPKTMAQLARGQDADE